MWGFFIIFADMIFKPVDNIPLRKSYPILKEYEEFRSLSDRELNFVWWHSCKSSPLYHLKGREKMTKLATECKDLFTSLKDAEVDEYLAGRFPENISVAMKVMESFNPEMRERGSAMTDKILSDFEFVVMQDIKASFMTSDAGKKSDAAELKNLIDIRINIAKNLPSIISASENGYGVKSKESKQDRKSLSPFEEE